jgi:hypothetical protein
MEGNLRYLRKWAREKKKADPVHFDGMIFLVLVDFNKRNVQVLEMRASIYKA